MNIPLKKRYADWIAEQVSAGRYASEIEAIEDALAAKIKADDAAWKADGEFLRERLRESEDDIRHGRTVVADDTYFERKKQMIRDRFMKPDQ